MNGTADFIIRHRWIVIAVFVAAAVVVGLQIGNAEMDPNVKNYVPPQMDARASTDKIEEIFGGTEMLMILMEADDVLAPGPLQRLEAISRETARLDGVERVLSLFDLKTVSGQDGAMVVHPAVQSIPQSIEERERLRKELRENDLVYGSVVSPAFDLAAVVAVVEPGTPDDRLVEQAQAVIAANPGPERVVLGGTPFSKVNTSANTERDFSRLLPVGLLAMLVFLYLAFRQIRGVILPFAVVLMSIFVAMGLIPILQWKIAIITVILPIFLIAVANDYGIHMIARYQEENTPGNNLSNRELARGVLVALWKPITTTGVTTMAGMLCLLGHVIIPAGQLGVLAAIGIGFALLASLFFVTAVLAVLPKPRPMLSPTGKNGFLDRMLSWLATVVTSKPRRVIVVMTVLAIAVGVGTFFVESDSDPVNYYPDDHPVPYSYNLINENLGGAFVLSVAFQGDIKHPALLAKIDRIEERIAGIPEVGHTTSIARVVRQMSRALNEPESPWYDAIPETREAAAQYFELYAFSGEPEDLEKMVDFPFEHALLTARIGTSSTPELERVIEQVNAIVAGDPDVLYVGGMAPVLTELGRQVVRGQYLSLVLALLTVSGLLMLLFRSPAAGLITAIPLALSALALFGLMGFLGIQLNMATALFSSIMIGVGVDYTIHFLWRYREERRAGHEPLESTRATLTTTGRGILFNAFSVIVGFVAFLASGFIPVRFFGLLIIVSIGACLVGALVLVPAICIVVRPRFLEPTLVQTGVASPSSPPADRNHSAHVPAAAQDTTRTVLPDPKSGLARSPKNPPQEA